jgi:hypothetical protein
LALLFGGAIFMSGELSMIFILDPKAEGFLPFLPPIAQVALIVGIFLLTLGFGMLKGCFLKDTIELTGTTLTMKRHFKSISFPLSELEGFFVGAEPESKSRLFSDSISGGIVAVSDTQYLRVAEHIPQSEIEYLHNVLLRRMVEIEEAK